MFITTTTTVPLLVFAVWFAFSSALIVFYWAVLTKLIGRESVDIQTVPTGVSILRRFSTQKPVWSHPVTYSLLELSLELYSSLLCFLDFLAFLVFA